MKKYIISFICIIIVFLFMGCSNQDSKNPNINDIATSVNQKNDLEHSSIESTSNPLETDISEIYINILGSKSEIDLDSEIIDLLEKSKTVKTPELNGNISEVGELTVVYKNSNDEISFGKIYIDTANRMFLKCNSNINNAVVELIQNDKSDSTTNVNDKIHSIYEEYHK